MTSDSPFETLLQFPLDIRRIVPVPAGGIVRVTSAEPFDLQTASGELLLATTSSSLSQVTFEAPAVETPQLLHLKITSNHFATATLALLVLPDAAQVFVPMQAVGPACGVLANPHGTAVQTRAAWAHLESQYDALLAFNPLTSGPADRRVVLPRVRQWLLVPGAQPLQIDARSVTSFAALSARVLRWRFAAQGLHWSVTLTLGDADDISLHWALDDAVCAGHTFHIRPDLEDRSFHTVTKAFMGPQERFPKAFQEVDAGGFCFALDGGFQLHLRATGAVFQSDPHWQYQVPLTHDAERGLSTATDVFSPGFFVWSPAERTTATLHAGVGLPASSLAVPVPESIPDAIPLAEAADRAMDLFIARRDDAWTVIAGYPWFLDWGRDSLIFVRGLLASGRLEQAGGIIRRFAAWEEAGSLPNMIRGNDASDRQTSDAPLWLVLAIREAVPLLPCVLAQVAGHRSLRQIVLDLVNAHAKGGTAHGVRMDPESGLLWSPPHYTWMDTHNPCGTPRQGYPIDIQALWASALDFAHELEPSSRYGELAALVRTSLHRLFWKADVGFYSDCLHTEGFRPAAQATADDHLRPGQLFAINLGATTDHAADRLALAACGELLVPGALRTLAPRPVQVPLPVVWNGEDLHDPFHPYHGQYTGAEETQRKPAYHNGTAWPWLFPGYVEALLRLHGEAVQPAARCLMASTAWLMQDGVLGHVAEIIDGDAPHRLRGCGAQAWSVSEWVRVWKKLQ